MACKRYLPPIHLTEFLKTLSSDLIKTLGYSVENRAIEMITLGTGGTKVLMWSQMHGNESTTTKALFDFIPWFLAPEQKPLREQLTLYIVPQLNPDGAERYTRFNALGVDLNRDAIELTQPESRVLREAYEKIATDLCLNLHGQRTIYAAGKGGPSASVSFLAPSANPERTVTPARKIAMEYIVGMFEALSEVIPNAIGRYDYGFNPNCVGDSYTQLGTPTLLFEAGHVPGDYQREQTRSHILLAYKTLVQQLVQNEQRYEIETYFQIPKNEVEFVDLILLDQTIVDNNEIKTNQKIALLYQEVLKDQSIHFLPEMVSYGTSLEQRAHQYGKLPDKIRSIPLEYKNGKMIENFNFDILYL